LKIAVIDGQGGGMGKAIVEKLRAAFGNDMDILALGTNALATSLMLKAGANEGASGENAIIYNVPKVDYIMGSIGIISANSMLGELTPNMARAIGESPARKILIPLNRCNIYVAGVKREPLPICIDMAIEKISDFVGGSNNV
jgi:hypothetical protein